MLGRVPEKFEQAAANEFSSATRNLASAFRALRERRRIGNLHLHGRNGRHGDVATIERRRNQSEAARFRGNVDWKPIASSEFFVEFDEGRTLQRAFPAPGGCRMGMPPTKTPSTSHDMPSLPCFAASQKTRNPGIASIAIRPH